jgi:hypothetical protein
VSLYAGCRLAVDNRGCAWPVDPEITHKRSTWVRCRCRLEMAWCVWTDSTQLPWKPLQTPLCSRRSNATEPNLLRLYTKLRLKWLCEISHRYSPAALAETHTCILRCSVALWKHCSNGIPIRPRMWRPFYGAKTDIPAMLFCPTVKMAWQVTGGPVPAFSPVNSIVQEMGATALLLVPR